MANPNVDAAAAQAGLNGREQQQISGLSKLLDSHKKLLALPENQAKASFQQMPQDQQNAHVAMFGGGKGPIGWLGDSFHYMGDAVKTIVAAPFKALNEVSDFMTRIYRTGAIAVDQGVDLGKAFEIANDKGDQVFSPSRIADAKKLYGSDTMSVAIKIASGQKLSDIIATGTDAEKQIASSNRKSLEPNFQSALDAAQAAKYSPGRQIANAILPSNLEGSGFLYKGISGFFDAGYRVFADPTLLLGKAKKAYDAGDFLLYNLLGKEKYTYGRNLMATAGNAQAVDRVFSNPGVTNLFDQYGSALTKLSDARMAGNKIAGAEAYKEAKRLIPEFGDVGIQELMKAGVKDATTAANYLKNHADVKNILSGQSARNTPLVPTMGPLRALRVRTFTTANKVFNIDKTGQSIVKAIYGDTAADVVTGLAEKSSAIAKLESAVGRRPGRLKDGATRLTGNQISGRIDRFARKFTTIPFFENGFFDVLSNNAPDKIYQLAALSNTRYHSRVIKEAFAAGDEGQRKQIFIGLWNTISETRQVMRTAEGKNFVDNFSGKGLDYKYGSTMLVEQLDNAGKPILDELGNKVFKEWNPANFDGQQMALHGYQLSSSLAVPSIIDLDRLSAHAGIINRVVGISHKKWADRVTSGWVIGTLAGPKFPVRNAGEDLMLHLAVGDSPWGIVKGRLVSTSIRQFKEAETGLTREQKVLGQSIADLKDVNIKLADEASTLAEGKIKTAKLNAIAENEASIAKRRASLQELDGKKIKFYESNLGFVNRLVGKKKVKEFQNRIAEAGDDVNKVRQIMAEAVMTNKLASRVLTEQDKGFLQEFAKYGRTQEILDSVAEGGKNALRGGDYSIAATNDTKNFGAVRALEYNGERWKQSGSGFTDLNPVATDEARLSWLVKLAIHTNDEIDSILIKNLDEPEIAISNLVDYLKSNPALKDRFQMYSPNVGATEFDHAKRAYMDVLNTFSKADGTLNKDLWQKIRKVGPDGEIKLSTRNLSVDDLPTRAQPDLHPRYISGPTLVQVSDTGNFAGSITEGLWDYMGEANARFSREALVIDAMLSIRKDMEDTGFAKRIMDQITAGKTGKELERANAVGMAHVTSIAEDMARERILSFVDNPMVRSQLAMAGRNFARFYRATEDFYRRIYRTVKYNPEALTRASLTYEGIAHSGFVQTDENGDQYFFYPGLTPVYKVMNKVMRVFGVQDGFKAPMPVEFGAKLKMITPSLNPDSLFPTFAGPLSAFPVKAVGNLIPQVKDLEQYLTGQYGVDQPMISAILPAHLNRLLQALSTDERNSQAASAMRKAATYLEATGHGLEIKIDPATGLEVAPSSGELAAYQDKLQASTFTVLALRFLTGFIAPASPSVNLKSDMAKWVRDNGTVSYKQAFNELITKYGDIDKASKEWVKLFPTEMPYTVSESETTVAANIRAVDGATQWLKDNKELVAKYPEAASFLIPNVGKFDFNAYKLLFKSGLRTNKTVTDFVREAAAAKDVQTYYAKKDEYDQQMAYTTSPDLKRQVRAQWDTWSSEFKGVRPYLQEQLSQGSAKAVQRLKALDDMRLMLNDKNVKTQPKLLEIYREMLSTYDSYVNQRDFSINAGVMNAQDYKDMIKNNAKNALAAIAEQDPNAMAAYNTLFAPLFR